MDLKISSQYAGEEPLGEFNFEVNKNFQEYTQKVVRRVFKTVFINRMRKEEKPISFAQGIKRIEKLPTLKRVIFIEGAAQIRDCYQYRLHGVAGEKFLYESLEDLGIKELKEIFAVPEKIKEEIVAEGIEQTIYSMPERVISQEVNLDVDRNKDIRDALARRITPLSGQFTAENIGAVEIAGFGKTTSPLTIVRVNNPEKIDSTVLQWVEERLFPSQ